MRSMERLNYHKRRKDLELGLGFSVRCSLLVVRVSSVRTVSPRARHSSSYFLQVAGNISST